VSFKRPKQAEFCPKWSPRGHARLTFTAELFLRAIFKYQVEVFGEHELIFLVVPKIVTTMTLVLAGGLEHPTLLIKIYRM
jgi:hypothetical protein